MASAESNPSDSVTTAKPTTSSVTTSQPPESKPDADDGRLIEIESEWHYKVFAASYNSTGPNGSYPEDTGLTGNPGDRVDSITYFDFDSPKFSDYIPEGITSYADLIDLPVEGENTFVATLKDAWGGRMFCLELAGCME